MDKCLLGAAVGALLSAGAPAFALDDRPFGFECECVCETASGISYQYYRDLGLGCPVLNNRTCNVENPQTGLIETGRTFGCRIATVNIGPPVNLDGVLDAGDTPDSQSGISGPLPGMLSR
jgi:hypothetical protein